MLPHCACVQKRTAGLLAGYIQSATVGDVCVRNSLKMVSELSPQFPCSAEADRIIRNAVEVLGGMKVSPDLQQLVFAAKRTLDQSAFKPVVETEGQEEGEVTVDGGDSLGGFLGPRGRGNVMADGIGGKRGRDFGMMDDGSNRSMARHMGMGQRGMRG
jgi:hypothetical protein